MNKELNEIILIAKRSGMTTLAQKIKNLVHENDRLKEENTKLRNAICRTDNYDNAVKERNMRLNA